MARVPFEAPIGVLPLASPPAAPAIGDTYFDTTLDQLRTWDGTEWVSGSGGSSAPQTVFVQDVPPITTTFPYVWFKTNMPGGGTDILIDQGDRILDEAVAYWKAGRYDADNSRLEDLSGNGLHAYLGPGVNAPTFLAYEGEKYSFHPGTAGNYASTNDFVPGTSGDIDIRVRIAAESLDDITFELVAAFPNFVFQATTAGRLSLRSVGSFNHESTVALSYTAWTDLWVRVTRTAVDGVHRFYTSLDGVVWTQLGADVVGVTGAIGTNVTLVEVRYEQGSPCKIYRVLVKDGVDGPTILDYNPALATPPYASFSSGGASWVFSRNTGKKLAVVDRTLLLLGTDDYLEVADNALPDFAANESFTVVIAVRLYGTSTNQVLIAKLSALSAAAGYALRRSSGAGGPIMATVADGTNISNDLATGVAPVAGTAMVVAGVRSVEDDTIAAFENGVGAASSIDTTTATLANTEALRIGRFSGAGVNYGDFEFLGAAIFRRALTAAELATLSAELGV